MSNPRSFVHHFFNRNGMSKQGLCYCLTLCTKLWFEPGFCIWCFCETRHLAWEQTPPGQSRTMLAQHYWVSSLQWTQRQLCSFQESLLLLRCKEAPWRKQEVCLEYCLLYCDECTHTDDYAPFRLLQSMSQELGKWLSNQEEKELEKQMCWSKPPPASLTSPPWRLPHTLLRASDVNKVSIHGHATNLFDIMCLTKDQLT